MKTVVIIGGGFSGISVANKLALKTKRKDVKIVLIEPKDMHVYEPQLLFWIFKDYTLSKFSKPIEKILSPKVNWLKTSATKINDQNQSINLSNGETIHYDYLVLATGAKMEEEKVNATNEDNVHHFYLPKAAEKLQKALKEFEEGTIVFTPTTVPYKCPPAAVEFVLLLDTYLRKKKIRDKVKIKYLYPLLRPYPTPNVAVKVQELLDKRGIEFIEFFNFESIDKENSKVVSLEGDEIAYDMLVIIPPHEGHDVIKDSNLGDREGFVITDKETLKVKEKENMYAIGDCTDLPVSKSGAVAHFSSNTLIKNILSDLKGKESNYLYNGKTICFVVTSFRRSLLLDFSYKNPPRSYGLHNSFVFGMFKKLFKIAYFQALIKGYM
jgi:sulfide:quinone oxidoreductase